MLDVVDTSYGGGVHMKKCCQGIGHLLSAAP